MLNNIIDMALVNLEQVGIGMALFLAVYISNIGLGAWKNVKIEGYDFDGMAILQSLAKFVVLGVSMALLSVAVSFIPVYAGYVGITIEAEVLDAVDSIVIIGAFLTATIRYAMDALDKIKAILGNGVNTSE